MNERVLNEWDYPIAGFLVPLRMIILFCDSWLSYKIVENSNFVCLRKLLKFI